MRLTITLTTIMVVNGANSLKPGLSMIRSPGRRPRPSFEIQGQSRPVPRSPQLAPATFTGAALPDRRRSPCGHAVKAETVKSMTIGSGSPRRNLRCVQ